MGASSVGASHPCRRPSPQEAFTSLLPGKGDLAAVGRENWVPATTGAAQEPQAGSIATKLVDSFPLPLPTRKGKPNTVSRPTDRGKGIGYDAALGPPCEHNRTWFIRPSPPNTEPSRLERVHRSECQLRAFRRCAGRSSTCPPNKYYERKYEAGNRQAPKPPHWTKVPALELKEPLMCVYNI